MKIIDAMNVKGADLDLCATVHLGLALGTFGAETLDKCASIAGEAPGAWWSSLVMGEVDRRVMLDA